MSSDDDFWDAAEAAIAHQLSVEPPRHAKQLQKEAAAKAAALLQPHGPSRRPRPPQTLGF